MPKPAKPVLEPQLEVPPKRRKSRNQNHQTKVLLRIADLINTTLNSTTLVRRILRETVDAVGAAGGLIAFCAEDSNGLQIAALQDIEGKGMALGEMLSESHCAAIALGRAVAVRCNASKSEPNSELACAIAGDGRAGGVIYLRGNKGQPFEVEDERLLLAICTQAGRIINTSRQYDRLQQQSRRLENLFEMGQQLIGSDPLPEVLNRITEALLTIVDVKQCTVMLVGKGHDLQLSAGSGGAGNYAQRRDNMESLVEKLSARGEAVKVLDVRKMEGRRPGKPAKQERLSSLLAVPVFYQQALVGILNVYTAEPRNFAEDEMSLLKAYANLCGVAIENARRHEQLLSAAEEIRLADRANTLKALSGDLAREVRNSLTANQILLDSLLEEGAFPAGGSADYDALSRNHGKINHIISRVEALGSRRAPQLEWLDVNAQVELVIDLSQHRLSGRQIMVHKRLASDLPRLFADKGDIQQAILQCITNAMESLRNGGILNIATTLIAGPEDQGGSPMIRINFRDTGGGLDAWDADELFDPFNRKNLKAGIGLFVAWKIATKYGGRLTARNATDHGASVSLTLPALEQH